MLFKLDENLDYRLAELFIQAGHDADTVLDEKLTGAADPEVFQACCDTGRVLITLDLDFANPFRFPPNLVGGIIVLRPERPILPLIRRILREILPLISFDALDGKLWIAEQSRIRVHDPDRAG